MLGFVENADARIVDVSLGRCAHTFEWMAAGALATEQGVILQLVVSVARAADTSSVILHVEAQNCNKQKSVVSIVIPLSVGVQDETAGGWQLLRSNCMPPSKPETSDILSRLSHLSSCLHV